MSTGTQGWGTAPWGTSPASPGNGLTLDVTLAFLDVIYRLGFTGLADVVSTAWVTRAELYQFGDDAAKGLSYSAGVFITYDGTVAIVGGTALYTLPAALVYVVAAALVYASDVQLLRITSVGELWALDALWSTATGSPTRASLDAGGPGTATLYPQPLAAATLGLVCQEYPATVTAAASTLPLPSVMQDYFSYAMLAGARGKESDAAMPEMAGHARERMKLYEAIAQDLWGRGQ